MNNILMLIVLFLIVGISFASCKQYVDDEVVRLHKFKSKCVDNGGKPLRYKEFSGKSSKYYYTCINEDYLIEVE